MPAAVLDIEFPRNGDWSQGFTAYADEDEIIDLTGATFDLDIRVTRGITGPPLLDIPVVCEDPETGYFEFTLYGSAFDNFGNKDTNSRFVYDVIAIQDGLRTPLLTGEILLTPGVSDNA